MSYNPRTFTSGEIKSLSSKFTNNSGSAIPKGMPVSINVSGELELVDVSNEASVEASVGVVGAQIANGQEGDVITSGRIENVVTSIPVGSPVFISKTGGLTTTPPEIGVGGFLSGDFCVRLGVIVKNRTNPLQKDFVVNPVIVGQL